MHAMQIFNRLLYTILRGEFGSLERERERERERIFAEGTSKHVMVNE